MECGFGVSVINVGIPKPEKLKAELFWACPNLKLQSLL